MPFLEAVLRCCSEPVLPLPFFYSQEVLPLLPVQEGRGGWRLPSPLHRVHGALQASVEPAGISRLLFVGSLERLGDVCSLTFNPSGISIDGLMIMPVRGASPNTVLGLKDPSVCPFIPLPLNLSGNEEVNLAKHALTSQWSPGLLEPGGGHGNPLQDSCLENSTDRGVWWAAVHGVAKSQTRLGD